MGTSIDRHFKHLMLLSKFIACCAFALMTGCASGPKLVDHSFSFNGHFDGWSEKIDLLAYDYGGAYHMVRNSVDNPRSEVFRGRTALPAGTGINGAMPLGEYLAVKRRIKATGEVRDVKVDLRPLLPKDMLDHKLSFVIDEHDLYMYVMQPKPDPKRMLAFNINKPLRLEVRPSYEIYPTNTYPKN